VRRFQIHLITDRKRTRGDLSRLVHQALAGGVDCVQVREKGAPALALYATVLELLPRAAEAGASLLVNDRVDVALATGADGVHLAAKSLPPGAARELLGDGPLLGRSVHSLREAREAADAGVDYVTFGHVYPTSSKPGLPPRGLVQLAEIVESVEVPVLAVGGIDASNVGQVLRTGASGIAVISTVSEAPNPKAAAERLRRATLDSPHHPRRVLRIEPKAKNKDTKGAR
jgi:thiamine-phosphate pyrophosphorylase